MMTRSRSETKAKAEALSATAVNSDEEEVSSSTSSYGGGGGGGRDDKGDDSSSCSTLDGSMTPSTSKMSRSESTIDEKAEVDNIIKKESRAVLLWRLIVFGMIITTAVLVTTLTYMFLEREEEADFVHGFAVLASKMDDHLRFNMKITFKSIEGFSEEATELASGSGSSWPFVYVADFGEEGEFMKDLTDTEGLWFAPLVSASDLDAWNTFATNVSPVPIYPSIYTVDQTDISSIKIQNVSKTMGPYAPVLQASPQPKRTIQNVTFPLNFDLLSNPMIANLALTVHGMHEAALSPVMQMPLFLYSLGRTNEVELNMLTNEGTVSPVTFLLQPVFDGDHDGDDEVNDLVNDKEDDEQEEEDEKKNDPQESKDRRLMDEDDDDEDDEGSEERLNIVGFVQALLDWERKFEDALPQSTDSMYCVLRNTCGQSYTFRVQGRSASYFGVGELHNPFFSPYKTTVQITSAIPTTETATTGACDYYVDMYPTQELRNASESDKPLIYTALIAGVFLFMGLTFLIYDRFVQHRNKKIRDAAVRSNAIVSSLFPAGVRERLFADNEGADTQTKEKNAKLLNTRTGLMTFLDEDTEKSTNGDGIFKTKPIADLFPETTIMFADLAGFTAWSSTREPSQVFTLLETVYHSFDRIAKQRRIFKVETVGDCYVAVTGLPEPRKDHAVAMAKFANDCLSKIHELTKKLEVALGPDTSDLSIRVGLHSGPVTAGVLRGERSRFQLFGDTMNTASRMESTGQRDRIQMSQDTAELISAAGKSHWLQERADKVYAKGKGEMSTYWLNINNRHGSGSSVDHTNSSDNTSMSNDDDFAAGMGAAEPSPDVARLLSERTARLINWNVELLLRNLKAVVARRRAARKIAKEEDCNDEGTCFVQTVEDAKHPIEEVKEIINLPQFDAQVAKFQEDVDQIRLSAEVVEEMHDYVSNIAAMYRDNPFHNFEHASHVAMSVTKLLSRIVAPDIQYHDDDSKNQATLHDHTYGITSDPLTQFACIFSALVHDVDHYGVPNTQLVKEGCKAASVYKNKSVAEQNSIDLAFSLLVDDDYTALRKAICPTECEAKRFRQLVINSVMATDIMDKDLKNLRNSCWDKAFSETTDLEDNEKDSINRKATIVIEHLIQASDVSHTMQHWHIYRKWNERFFSECYRAYAQGRAETDPSENWYKGEIGFFDFYIIPLAKKLKNCGVFGVSSDEYLSYAEKNRKEWEAKGEEVVASMIEKVRKEYKPTSKSGVKKRRESLRA